MWILVRFRGFSWVNPRRAKIPQCLLRRQNLRAEPLAVLSNQGGSRGTGSTGSYYGAPSHKEYVVWLKQRCVCLLLVVLTLSFHCVEMLALMFVCMIITLISQGLTLSASQFWWGGIPWDPRSFLKPERLPRHVFAIWCTGSHYGALHHNDFFVT